MSDVEKPANGRPLRVRIGCLVFAIAACGLLIDRVFLDTFKRAYWKARIRRAVTRLLQPDQPFPPHHHSSEPAGRILLEHRPPNRPEPPEMVPIGPPPMELLASAQGVKIPVSPVSVAPPRTAERPEFAIRLRFEFCGKPLRLGFPATYAIRLFDNQEYKTREISLPVGSDEYVISNLLPGTFSCQVAVDADTTNPPGFPGDFRGNAWFGRTPDIASAMVVPLVRHLRMLEPVPNDQIREGGATVTGTVRIAWEPISEVDTYKVTLSRLPNGWPREQVITTDSIALMDLTPDQYELTLEGLASRTVVALGLYQYRFSISTPFGPRVSRNQVGHLPVFVQALATAPLDLSFVWWHDGNGLRLPATVPLDLRVLPKYGETPLEVAFDRSPGSFTIRGLKPGPYRLEVRIDLNPANGPDGSGDLFGARAFTAPSGPRESPIVFLTRNVRLLYPEDTDDPHVRERHAKGGFAKVQPPLVIGWEAVPGASLYRYTLNPPYVFGSTSGTSLLMNVPGGAACNLQLDAYSEKGNQVGKLRIDGVNRSYPIFVEPQAESPNQPVPGPSGR